MLHDTIEINLVVKNKKAFTSSKNIGEEHSLPNL